MGRRKERRIAAMMAAGGRRVKLDLCVEPTGDLGGFSANAEVGEDGNTNPDAGLPKSPSSSGVRMENPLSLLGQYSDDELDESSNDRPDAMDKTLADHDDQAKEPFDKQFKEVKDGRNEDLSPENANRKDIERDSITANASEIVVANGASGVDLTGSDDVSHEIELPPENSVPAASDIEVPRGVDSCWKLVLHEETNRYYYWNTDTGETSWEIPDALAQETGAKHEQETLQTDQKESSTSDDNMSNSTPEGKVDDDVSASRGMASTEVSDAVMAYEHGSHNNQSVKPSETDGNQLCSSAVGGASQIEMSALPNYSSYHRSTDAVVGCGSSIVLGAEAQNHSAITDEGDASAFGLLSYLVNYGESLLERLKLRRGSRNDSHQHDWVSKYISEIEVRLSDVKSLFHHGSSLNPFWQHSKRQLSVLENAICKELTEENTNVSTGHVPSTEGRVAIEEQMEKDLETGADMRRVGSSENSLSILYDVQRASHEGALYDRISNMETASLHEYPALLHYGEEKHEEIREPSVLASPKNEPIPQSTEDVDMDVDMEVEDTTPARNLTFTEAESKTNPLSEEESLEPGEWIPPPPDEEWIPPPPPDDGGIPPPPSEEPPEPSYPPPVPSYSGPGQSHSYDVQYNMAYADSNFSYYGISTTQALGGSLYGHAEGNNVASPNAPVYYDTIVDTHLAAAVIANPIEPLAYYGLQNGALPAAPAVTAADYSAYHSVSGPASVEVGSMPNASAGVATIEAAPSHVPSTSSTETASTSISEKDCIPGPSTSVSIPAVSVASGASTVASKAPSKVSRVKKPKVAVASSLRSNKKVSSLVDKWKAAKEELEEEEEEKRETALETLEKKRQREIEEWRAQQIASGEAKDNANFQPLGGDWRERVKRRRAQKEAAETSPDAASVGAKQPDLTELSRDLPSGWQAYWDESSGRVYYGNAITSQTSWTKPTQ